MGIPLFVSSGVCLLHGEYQEKLNTIHTQEQNLKMSDTLFLLDMLRNANQDKIRAKKDALILDMAMEQKKKMAEGKMSGGRSTSYSTGGFVGVDQLTKSGNHPKSNMKKIRHEEMEENPSTVKTQDSEMFILGLLKEQRQEEIYKEREKQISEESVGCVSDEKCMRKFQN